MGTAGGADREDYQTTFAKKLSKTAIGTKSLKRCVVRCTGRRNVGCGFFGVDHAGRADDSRRTGSRSSARHG